MAGIVVAVGRDGKKSNRHTFGHSAEWYFRFLDRIRSSVRRWNTVARREGLRPQ